MFFREGEWVAPTTVSASTAETDRLHALLVMRADELDGCTEGSPKEQELEAITDAGETRDRAKLRRAKKPAAKAS
jgi:hypothetical protein